MNAKVENPQGQPAADEAKTAPKETTFVRQTLHGDPKKKDRPADRFMTALEENGYFKRENRKTAWRAVTGTALLMSLSGMFAVPLHVAAAGVGASVMAVAGVAVAAVAVVGVAKHLYDYYVQRKTGASKVDPGYISAMEKVVREQAVLKTNGGAQSPDYKRVVEVSLQKLHGGGSTLVGANMLNSLARTGHRVVNPLYSVSRVASLYMLANSFHMAGKLVMKMGLGVNSTMGPQIGTWAATHGLTTAGASVLASVAATTTAVGGGALWYVASRAATRSNARYDAERIEKVVSETAQQLGARARRPTPF